jgi:hypothetical protein
MRHPEQMAKIPTSRKEREKWGTRFMAAVGSTRHPKQKQVPRLVLTARAARHYAALGMTNKEERWRGKNVRVPRLQRTQTWGTRFNSK